MQSIGEQLEEARKRKGISLREASEATKIHSDFLSNIEQNQFDFELPEIYKRGFIKNYANYLKLDAQSILTDYNAQLLSHSHNGKKAGSELFGSMELTSASGNASEPLLGKISKNPQADETEDMRHGTEIDKVFYLKLVLAALGVLTFLFVIVGLITAILSRRGKLPSSDRVSRQVFMKKERTFWALT